MSRLRKMIERVGECLREREREGECLRKRERKKIFHVRKVATNWTDPRKIGNK